jgi:restriction system protein
MLAAAILAARVTSAHPVATTLTVTLIAATGAIWWSLRVARSRRLAGYERDIAVTDHMTGPQFEDYVARLMRDSGCRRVRVCGGAGDMGADVIGYSADGRRLVVQCKRYKGNLGSPDVQRFAGTARDIHGADVALLVTTGRPSAQARDVARRCRITLVDRAALARWVGTGTPPFASDQPVVPVPPPATDPLTPPVAPITPD